MKKSYYEKLKDPRWQRKRLEILDDAKFECQNCGEDKKPLNVHHILYRKGTDPWDYHPSLLQCLCEKCHEEWHDQRDEFNENLAQIESQGLGIEEFFWLAEGIVFENITALEQVELTVKSRLKILRSKQK